MEMYTLDTAMIRLKEISEALESGEYDLEMSMKLYEEGKLTKLYSTNLSYIPEEAKNAPWFVEVDLSKYLAKIINTLNHDQSISPLLDSVARTQYFLHEIGKQ